MLSSNILFGDSLLNSRRKYQKVEDEEASMLPPPSKGSLSHFFFGFMYEDISDDDDDSLLYSSTIESTSSIWNPLNASLFSALTLIALSTSVPFTIATAMGDQAFAPQATASAVLGASLGKFINGPVADLAGARRTMVVYSIALAVALVFFACAQTESHAAAACFLVEFCYSVHWPCVIIILATHYRGKDGMYEGGIYLTSLAARMGSLVGIPTWTLLLRHWHWRAVALVGAYAALVASSIVYFYVSDAPEQRDAPQNPIDFEQWDKWFGGRRKWSTGVAIKVFSFVLQANVIPSVKHVLSSGTFWIVALAHTGASAVRTSERVVGSYLVATSDSTLSENRAAGLAVFLSIGMVAGLIIGGGFFAHQQERERKWLVSRLYLLAIVSCYVLALFSLPWVRRLISAPTLLTVFQVVTISAAGFGVAVQFYHIPGLVGATFGCDKGLFSAYSDGIAYGIASFTWRIVSNVIQSNAQDIGWAYAWAAIALILLPSAVLMVEFMEHYFCRHRHGGKYETIIFA